MKRIHMIIGVFFIVCIMMSVVTAVPQKQSEPVMNVINDIEAYERAADETNEGISTLEPQPGGLIDFLKQLVMLIIQMILKLIDIIRNLIGLVALIDYLIDLIMTLIEVIVALIERIMDLLNPGLIGTYS